MCETKSQQVLAGDCKMMCQEKVVDIYFNSSCEAEMSVLLVKLVGLFFSELAFSYQNNISIK